MIVIRQIYSDNIPRQFQSDDTYLRYEQVRPTAYHSKLSRTDEYKACSQNH